MGENQISIIFGTVLGIVLTLTALGILPGKILVIGFLVTLFILVPTGMIVSAKYENWRTNK